MSAAPSSAAPPSTAALTTPLPPDALAALDARLGAGRVRKRIALAQYTSFRIGGPADALYTARTADELAAAVLAARELQIPYFLLGLGANILVGDRGYRGLVIRNRADHFRFRPVDADPAGGAACHLVAESGAVMQDLVLDAVERGWSGLEHFIGIPSTVGGAVWQNLHFLSPAPERDRTMFIADVFESADILSEENERRTVDAAYVGFGYDDTVFHHRRDIVLSATFRLTRGDVDRMHRVLHENLSWRGARHPWLQIHPSAGSIFKKLDGVGAGRLVDQVGMKGHRHGGAQISPLHANIIVNRGRATARDVRELIALAQEAVARETGHRLEPEIGFVGEF